MPHDIVPGSESADETNRADAADGGWSVESHSAPATLAPDDTTVDPQGIDNAPQPEEAEAQPAVDGEEHASAPDQAAEGTKPTPKKKKQTFQERIDELTRQRYGVDRDLASERAARQDLERRLAALEKGTGAKPTPDEKPGEKKAAAAALREKPKHPKYADFDTDEDYTAAVATYEQNLDAWQDERETALKTEITSSLERRLAEDRQRAAQAAQEQAVVTAVQQVLQDPALVQNVNTHPELYRSIAIDAPHAGKLLFDLVYNRSDGGEIYQDLVAAPEMAQALVALPLPSRPLADAVRHSPAARALMKHFATEDGREDFLRLRSLHPVRVLAEIGKLEAVLDAAARGPASGAHRSITSAVPPAKPPVGSPRARTEPGGAPPPFNDWMAAEDEKEEAERRRLAGLSVSA